MRTKKYSIYIFGVITIIIVLSVPFAINESYKLNNGYFTKWDAATALSFYGAFLSFVSTTLLGILALWLNHKLYAMNTRLFHIEENKQRPYIDLKNQEGFVELYDGDSNSTAIRVRVYLKNTSSAVIKRCKLVDSYLYKPRFRKYCSLKK